MLSFFKPFRHQTPKTSNFQMFLVIEGLDSRSPLYSELISPSSANSGSLVSVFQRISSLWCQPGSSFAVFNLVTSRLFCGLKLSNRLGRNDGPVDVCKLGQKLGLAAGRRNGKRQKIFSLKKKKVVV